MPKIITIQLYEDNSKDLYVYEYNIFCSCKNKRSVTYRDCSYCQNYNLCRFKYITQSMYHKLTCTLNAEK